MASKVVSQMKTPDFDQVYTALKNGDFVEKLDMFSDEQLQPFLPIMMISAFSPSNNLGSSEADVLRSRLMNFPQCNAFMELISVDFTLIEGEVREMEKKDHGTCLKIIFESAGSYDKVKYIAVMLYHACEGDRTGMSADIFDCEHLLEEIVCIIIACIIYMPTLLHLPSAIPSLLPHSCASQIIFLIACNLPLLMEPFVNELLLVKIQDDESVIAVQRETALTKLLLTEKSLISNCLVRLLNLQTSTVLAVRIMSATLSVPEFISWLSMALLTRLPIFAFIQKFPTKPSVELVHQKIATCIEEISLSGNSVDAARLAQLLACLRLSAGFRLSPQESRSWALFLTRTDCDDSHYICTALSTVVACSNLITLNSQLNEDKEVEASFTAFLEWLKAGTATVDGSAKMRQFFLLLSIHLHATQIDQLAAFLSTFLGFKVSMNLRNLSSLRSVFQRHGLSEKEMAERASQMLVTKGLSEKHQGFLPAHCIFQLLSTRLFAKYLVPVEKWVCCQLMECSTPVHPIIAETLVAYAESCFPCATEPNCTNAPLPESFIKEVFSGDVMDEARIVPRILSLFFVLSYRSVYDKHLCGGTTKYAYSSELEAVMPIRYLLNIVEARPTNFQALRSPLIRLCGQYYSYMLPTCDSFLLLIHDELSQPCSGIDDDRGFRISEEKLANALRNVSAEPSTAVRLMRQLEWSSLRDQVRLQPLIVSAVVASLESSTPLAFIASVTSIWKRLENIDPRHLFQDTVCACSKEKFDHAMLTEQPLLLFRCDDRLFSNGSLLSCFLDMLSFYNQASKSLLVQKLAEAPFNASNRDDQRAECDELTRAAMGAQDSAIVQLLLEICERTKDDRVRQLACGHIHQMFIADPMLSKLVHFQGYPVRLIPIAVSGIPSMHICLEFVHELLALPDINKRVFAIVLVAELSRQYKIESSFLRVELIVDILSLLMKTLPCDEILSLCMETVPSLGQMMTIFPQIAPDITHFLAQISVIAKSRMALSATVLKPRSSPERKLIDLICRTLADKAAEMSITNLAG